MKLKYADQICNIKNPLDWTADQVDLMVKACREIAEFHYEHSREIRHLYQKASFLPDSIQSEEDLERIPTLGVAAMKSYLILSRPESEAVLKLTSSGTRGQKTQIWLDQASLDRAQNMLDVLWEQEGLTSDRPTHYVNFIYDPEEAKDLGISFSVKNEERFAPVKSSYFTVKKDKTGQWEFRKEETIRHLETIAKEGYPVRFFGIPSFMFELLDWMKGRAPIKLPKGSMMMTGGGWKAAEDKAVTREAFRRLIQEYFGMEDALLRDGYGMAEHAAPYMECRHHRFHIPAYNRVYARDPVTMRVLPKGEAGLLEFLTPLNTMMPNLAILSTDMGKLDEAPCTCGWNAPTFTLLGRGGISKHKGCALTANEIVKRD